MVALGLIVSLFVAQPWAQGLYEWVDEAGESHFTNLPDTIPEGVQRLALTFDEPVPVVEKREAKAPPLREVAPAVRAAESPDSCEVARQQVVQLELEVERQQRDLEQEQQRQQQECQGLLNTHGHGAWALCMASRREPRSADGALQARLEEAREVLRRMQVGGCRRVSDVERQDGTGEVRVSGRAASRPDERALGSSVSSTQ